MNTMNEWVEAAKHELGIDLDVDVNEVLDLTRTVAHNVARPVAPLGAFLVGYAAAQAGGGAEAVTTACRTAAGAAEQWAADHGDDTTT